MLHAPFISPFLISSPHQYSEKCNYDEALHYVNFSSPSEVKFSSEYNLRHNELHKAHAQRKSAPHFCDGNFEHGGRKKIGCHAFKINGMFVNVGLCKVPCVSSTFSSWDHSQLELSRKLRCHSQPLCGYKYLELNTISTDATKIPLRKLYNTI
jgi:hypothetical protein